MVNNGLGDETCVLSGWNCAIWIRNELDGLTATLFTRAASLKLRAIVIDIPCNEREKQSVYIIQLDWFDNISIEQTEKRDPGGICFDRRYWQLSHAMIIWKSNDFANIYFGMNDIWWVDFAIVTFQTEDIIQKFLDIYLLLNFIVTEINWLIMMRAY